MDWEKQLWHCWSWFQLHHRGTGPLCPKGVRMATLPFCMLPALFQRQLQRNPEERLGWFWGAVKYSSPLQSAGATETTWKESSFLFIGDDFQNRRAKQRCQLVLRWSVIQFQRDWQPPLREHYNQPRMETNTLHSQDLCQSSLGNAALPAGSPSWTPSKSQSISWSVLPSCSQQLIVTDVWADSASSCVFYLRDIECCQKLLLKSLVHTCLSYTCNLGIQVLTLLKWSVASMFECHNLVYDIW